MCGHSIQRRPVYVGAHVSVTCVLHALSRRPAPRRLFADLLGKNSVPAAAARGRRRNHGAEPPLDPEIRSGPRPHSVAWIDLEDRAVRATPSQWQGPGPRPRRPSHLHWQGGPGTCHCHCRSATASATAAACSRQATGCLAEARAADSDSPGGWPLSASLSFSEPQALGAWSFQLSGPLDWH